MSSDVSKTTRYFAIGGRELAPDEVLPDMSNVGSVEKILPTQNTADSTDKQLNGDANGR